ncbi:M16 family metallopeptidase [Vreelandella zhaodongensis]|uniref:Insulinase family protein n=1 Tax=Vreelandella zhaodongensis TaxID=1176240 RepID=A0ABX2ST06_VREZH|nr:insulinase family protein [Halomonas zhaodongensis]NYS45018.1 insulinase family protein [Halomonas zhaodongensis]
MIRLIPLTAMVISLAACSAEETNGSTPSASNEVSPEGIEFTLLAMPDSDDVAVQAAWPTDWAYRENTNPAAALVGAEMILAGGAEGYPEGEAAEQLADLNTEGGLYGSANDHIVGELVFERDDINEVVEIANAHLRAPLLGQSWLDRISDGITQGVREERAQPGAAGFEAIRWAVFGEHPLRNALSLYDLNPLDELTRDDITAWHAETFTRSPEAVAVAGDIDARSAGEALDTLLAGLPEQGREVKRNVSPDFTPRRILLHMPQAEVSTLAFIAPLPPTRDGGEVEDLLLTHALGSDDQSVLFDAVRTQLRASYGFGAGVNNYTREHRILFMAGEVDTNQMAEAEAVVREAYANFRQNGLEGDLADHKAPLASHFSEVADRVMVQANSALESALDEHPVERSLKQELEAVTEASLNERLDTAFPSADEFIVIAVSPDADALPEACVIITPREAAGC